MVTLPRSTISPNRCLRTGGALVGTPWNRALLPCTGTAPHDACDKHAYLKMSNKALREQVAGKHCWSISRASESHSKEYPSEQQWWPPLSENCDWRKCQECQPQPICAAASLRRDRVKGALDCNKKGEPGVLPLRTRYASTASTAHKGGLARLI